MSFLFTYPKNVKLMARKEVLVPLLLKGGGGGGKGEGVDALHDDLVFVDASNALLQKEIRF